MKILTNKMNINIHDVVDAAGSKPFGFKKFVPGPGVGGHCIPIDPYYLDWASKKIGYKPKFIKIAGEINTYIPKWIVSKLINASFPDYESVIPKDNNQTMTVDCKSFSETIDRVSTISDDKLRTVKFQISSLGLNYFI